MGRHRTANRLLSLALPIALLTLIAGTNTVGAADKKAGAKARPKATAVSTLPTGTRLDSRTLAHHIDEAIDARLRAEKVPPSPACDDAEFLRRVYLDLTGHVPSAEKAAAFLASRDADKRSKLIDELLASSDYGKHQADIWQSLLLPRNSDNRFVPFDKMTKWLEEGFNANKPWDQMVRDIVTAGGDMDKNGAVTYFLANATPDKLTDNASRVFLGVQLQCAQCHNHPFTDWKQEAYWGMAAFFTKVRMNGNPRQVQRQGGTVTIGEDVRGRPLRLPESAKRLPPKFLQGEQPKLDAGEPYRPALAHWMTSPSNPYFSRAMVNRVWSQLFGRGLVNPVDDMHEGNAPSHPELLADLSAQFAAAGFDVKALYRAVCNSRAYQRTSRPSADNAEAAPELFSRMAIKVMTPEQMFDSLREVVGATGPTNLPRRAGAAGRRPNNSPRTVFVAFFKGDENADPTEYQAGIPQVLRLMNSPQLNNAAMLAPLLKSGKKPAEIVEHLYLATLSRRPTSRELERSLELVRKHAEEPRQAYGDVLWVLLNSSEFTLNH